LRPLKPITQQHADDVQLIFAFDLVEAIDDMERKIQCVADIKNLMSADFLKPDAKKPNFTS